jgi:hypothetical protein
MKYNKKIYLAKIYFVCYFYAKNNMKKLNKKLNKLIERKKF